jgi:uncharacterized protein (TIGR00255 family)
MTGFGRAPFSAEGLGFDVDVRCVNHRFLDLHVRLPRPLAALEPGARARVQARFARGKVDVVVSASAGETPAPRLEIDLEAAARYLEAAEALRRAHGLAGALDVASVLALPGVARTEERELAAASAGPAFFAALDAALDAADAMRVAEGAALEQDLRARLGRVRELVAAIEARSSSIRSALGERLRKRAEELRRETGLLDETRLYHELALASDRLDVTEELVRLSSHVDQFAEALDRAGPGEPVGRRLDFLLQEFGRESNTIGSKANDAPEAHLVVELKTELERVREQVQNVE